MVREASGGHSARGYDRWDNYDTIDKTHFSEILH
jgi:hypothetical protein